MHHSITCSLHQPPKTGKGFPLQMPLPQYPSSRLIYKGFLSTISCHLYHIPEGRAAGMTLILKPKKMKHREVEQLACVTQLVGGRAGMRPQCSFHCDSTYSFLVYTPPKDPMGARQDTEGRESRARHRVHAREGSGLGWL